MAALWVAGAAAILHDVPEPGRGLGPEEVVARWWRAAFLLATGTVAASVAVGVMTRRILALLGQRERDVAEARRAQQAATALAAEMAAARAAAEAADQAKGRFLATMSHELRTPLNAIIGFAELVAADREGAVPPEQVREFMVEIAQGGHTLLGIVNDVLDVARVSAGWRPADTPVDPAGAIQECAWRAAHAAQTRAVALRVAAADGLPSLRGDAGCVARMLDSLVGNAVTFGAAAVTIGARAAAGGLELWVADDGPGIAPADLPRLLEPFEQGDGSHSRGVGGPGLGLTVARALCEAHGGALSIVSAPGRGTEVRLSFPADRCLPA